MAEANSTVEKGDPQESNIEALGRMFDETPEELISTIKYASDTLFELESIFNVIAEKAKAGGTIIALARAGACLAMDIGNYTACRREELSNSLSAANRDKGEETAT